MSGEDRNGPVRVGLVGCGRLAELGYVPASRRAAGVRLVAVADPDRGRRARVAALAATTVECVTDHAGAAELIAAGAVDGVVIASPPSKHLDDAALAAMASLPALVEKPPAPDGRSAGRLAALEPPPWVGFNRRFAHGVALRGRVPDDVELELDLEVRYRRASWGAYTVRPDALTDIGPHMVDLALFVTRAEPLAVRGASAEFERAAFELVTNRGVARARCATNRLHRERVRVGTPGGPTHAAAASGGLGTGALTRLRGRPHPLVASLALQLEAFGRAVRGLPAEPLGDAATGARVMAVIDAARDSARSGGAEVTVQPFATTAGPVAGTAR